MRNNRTPATTARTGTTSLQTSARPSVQSVAAAPTRIQWESRVRAEVPPCTAKRTLLVWPREKQHVDATGLGAVSVGRALCSPATTMGKDARRVHCTRIMMMKQTHVSLVPRVPTPCTLERLPTIFATAGLATAGTVVPKGLYPTIGREPSNLVETPRLIL